MANMQTIVKIFLFLSTLVVVSYCESTENFLPIEPPKFYHQDPSPLANRESLKRPEYYDFLNTLYRHDRTKSNLFEGNPINPIFSSNHFRRRRAIVFRPLFVYRQQQIKREKLRPTKRS